METTQQRTSWLNLALAWLVVTIPLGWGVYQTVVKSLPLFVPSHSAPTAPPSPRR